MRDSTDLVRAHVQALLSDRARDDFSVKPGSSIVGNRFSVGTRWNCLCAVEAAFRHRVDTRADTLTLSAPLWGCPVSTDRVDDV
jgi:hypothetical protein